MLRQLDYFVDSCRLMFVISLFGVVFRFEKKIRDLYRGSCVNGSLNWFGGGGGIVCVEGNERISAVTG